MWTFFIIITLSWHRLGFPEISSTVLRASYRNSFYRSGSAKLSQTLEPLQRLKVIETKSIEAWTAHWRKKMLSHLDSLHSKKQSWPCTCSEPSLWAFWLLGVVLALPLELLPSNDQTAKLQKFGTWLHARFFGQIQCVFAESFDLMLLLVA